jgi:hypothetical protein
LAEFEKLAMEYVESDKEREQLGLDPNEYATYSTLKPNVNGINPNLPRGINSLFIAYPDYMWNEQQQKKVWWPTLSRQKNRLN